MIRNLFFENYFTYYKTSSFAKIAKKRRFKVIDEVSQGLLSQKENKLKISDIGCGRGADFLQFAKSNTNLELYGIDISDRRTSIRDFNFIQADAASIDVPDNYFDLVVSIGVLEHIQPISKLQKVIEEIDRISKSYCIMVPSLSCIIEPHTLSLFWQIRAQGNKVVRENLNYYSDEAWLRFDGFLNASTKRFLYLPGISNLIIYKNTR